MTTTLTLDLIRDETIYEVELEYTVEKSSPSYVARENAVEGSETLEVIAVYLNDVRVQDFAVTTEELVSLTERAAETVRDAEEMEDDSNDD